MVADVDVRGFITISKILSREVWPIAFHKGSSEAHRDGMWTMRLVSGFSYFSQ